MILKQDNYTVLADLMSDVYVDKALVWILFIFICYSNP